MIHLSAPLEWRHVLQSNPRATAEARPSRFFCSKYVILAAYRPIRAVHSRALQLSAWQGATARRVRGALARARGCRCREDAPWHGHCLPSETVFQGSILLEAVLLEGVRDMSIHPESSRSAAKENGITAGSLDALDDALPMLGHSGSAPDEPDKPDELIDEEERNAIGGALPASDDEDNDNDNDDARERAIPDHLVLDEDE
jgi:hypothetical protein